MSTVRSLTHVICEAVSHLTKFLTFLFLWALSPPGDSLLASVAGRHHFLKFYINDIIIVCILCWGNIIHSFLFLSLIPFCSYTTACFSFSPNYVHLNQLCYCPTARKTAINSCKSFIEVHFVFLG